MPIPKTLHYCWFGGNQLPRLYSECISTWEQAMPDYTIKRWDESNVVFDTPFLIDAYNKKKWAFISDYIRMRVLYLEGGIYLDSDFEVVRSFNDLLNQKCFLAEEREGRPTTGVFGCIAGEIFPLRCMEIIDSNFSLRRPYEITPEVAARALRSIDNDNITIYPSKMFYPYNPYDPASLDTLMFKNVGPDVYAIHHWGKGWSQPLYQRVLKKLYRKFYVV